MDVGQHSRSAFPGLDDGLYSLSGWKGAVRVRTMLKQVLREFETAQGPITVRELSRKLKVDPNALEAMIQFWVRKGRIQDDDATISCSEEMGDCSTSCCGTANCAFIAKMPKTYSIPEADTGQKPMRKP